MRPQSYCDAVFQQMEVDYVIGHPNREVHRTDLTEVPIIRMYGVTETGVRASLPTTSHCLDWQLLQQCVELYLSVCKPCCCHAGNSICAFVHGFEPYFYVEAPPGFGPDDCDSLRALLNVSRNLSLGFFLMAITDV